MKFKWFYKAYKVVGWFTILSAGIILALRLGMPLLTPQVPKLSEWVAKELKYPTLIQDIKLKFDGLSPEVSLYNVEVLTQDKKSSALHAQKIKLRLNTFQLLRKKLQVDEIVIEGLVGGIRYDHHQKKFSVTKLEQLSFSFSSIEENAPLFKRLFIYNSALEIKTDLEAHFKLQDLNLLIEMGSKVHVRAASFVEGKKPAHVEFGADIPVFSNKSARVYCHWEGGDLNPLAKLWPSNEFGLTAQDADLFVWADIKQKNINLILDFATNDLHLDRFSKEVLSFQKAKGQVFAKINQDRWEIKSQDLILTENKESETVNVALKTEGQKWHFTISQLNMSPWQRRLKALNLLTENAFLNNNTVKGYLLHADFLLNKQINQFYVVTGDFVFNNLGLTSTQYPSFENLNGAIALADNKGRAILTSNAFTIKDKQFYEKPLCLNNLALSVNWDTATDEVITVDSFSAHVSNTPLYGEAKISFEATKPKPDVEMMFHVGNSSTDTLLSLLPLNYMEEELSTWLKSAIKRGEHLGTKLVLRGNLSDFPFDKGEGVFQVALDLDHTYLDYKPNWPALEDLKASLLFHNRALFISAHSGTIHQGKISDADAVIPDLFAKMPELIVDTKIASTLKDGMDVIANSPLPQGLIKTLAPLSLQGNMALSLGLEIPLSAVQHAPVKVRGLVEVSDATAAMKDHPYVIEHIKGQVSFTQDSVRANTVSGELFGMPTTFDIASLQDKANEIKITAKGNVNVEKIKTLFQLADLKQVQGETDYVAILNISPDNESFSTLSLNSSLKGISIDAPNPFAKTADAVNALELKLYLDPNQLLRVTGKYGDNVSLAYSLGLRDKVWHSVGGHIHFGESRLAKFREDQVLLIDGHLDQFDFLQWKTFLAGSEHLSNNSNPISLEPLVELQMGAFTLYGASFENENVQARWDAKLNQWTLLFDGAMLKGQMDVPKNNTLPIVVDLQKLALPNKLAESNFTMSKVPSTQGIDIKIKEFAWGNKSFSAIAARLEPSWNGYLIPNITAKLVDADLNLSGSWDYLSTNKISAQGKLATRNVSATLKSLGLKGTVQKAKGAIDFSLSWNGSPFTIDFPTLTGLADFSLKEGMIVGMNPGIGRVLGLLNLDNVKRRLNLDFSDVTKDGLAFNELTGKFQFGKGKVSSNKLFLNGPSAKIEAFGQADLMNQGLDGEMVVMPNVTGSLPVAAAIAAGNPAVGAAVWVVDKMFGPKIQEIHRVRYKVLGTWVAPKVNEIPIPLKG